MNYRLSSTVNRPKGKMCFVLELGGKTLQSYISNTESDNLKSELLSIMTMGLRSCRPYLKHEDILYIDVQNRHLQQWLDGAIEYKEYAEQIDEVLSVLETLNCRYKFMFNNKPYAKVFLERNTKNSIQGSSISDIDME